MVRCQNKSFVNIISVVLWRLGRLVLALRNRGQNICSRAYRLEGEFEFGEDPLVNEFDIQIKQFKAKISFSYSQDQNSAWFYWILLTLSFLVVNGAHHFQKKSADVDAEH